MARRPERGRGKDHVVFQGRRRPEEDAPGLPEANSRRGPLVGDFFAFEDGLRNGVFPAVGDVNGDGKADLVVGAGPGGGPRVSVFAGNDLLATPSVQTRIADFFAGDPNRRDGVRVAVKDLDGDAKADLVVAVGPTVLAYSGKGLSAGTSVADLSANLLPGQSDGVFVG